ncbi:sericin 1-like [Cydia strobilella]|uniref:sericin 1-like n=1 Tax=Cydia strobilella TaxID=1100964 RepID=UPI0030050997
MNHAKFCLCFVLVVLTVNQIKCRGGHEGHGGGHGHSSHGHSSHSSHGSHTSHGGGWLSGLFSGGSKSSGSSSHSYPLSTGYSGHGSGGSHTYPNSHGLSGSGGAHWSSSHYSSYTPSRPTYYTAPQYVYVTHYRETQSPYSDLLTGLTMYNLGRSHHYHHHYYNDDYQRSGSSGGYYNQHSNTGSEWQNNNAAGTNDEAKCVLKIQKNGKLEVLSIPCAIVSTFDNGNHTSNDAAREATGIKNCTSAVNSNSASVNNSLFEINNTVVTPCVNQTVNITDPLSVTGAPIAEATNMECSVEIRTKQDVIQNSVDCNTLLKYAKIAVPEDKSTNVLPTREALKAMLNKPPWWMSLFIVV